MADAPDDHPTAKQVLALIRRLPPVERDRLFRALARDSTGLRAGYVVLSEQFDGKLRKCIRRFYELSGQLHDLVWRYMRKPVESERDAELFRLHEEKGLSYVQITKLNAYRDMTKEAVRSAIRRERRRR